MLRGICREAGEKLVTKPFSQRHMLLPALLALAAALTCGPGASGAIITLPTPLIEVNFNTQAGAQSLASTGSVSVTGTFMPASPVGAVYSSTHGPKDTGGYATELKYNGNNGYVDFTDLSALEQLASFTIAAWIYPHTTSGYLPIVTDIGSNKGYDFQIHDGKLSLMVENGSAESTATISANQWSFVAVTYDGTNTTNNVMLYIGSAGSDTLTSGSNTINKGTTRDNSVNFTIGKSGSSYWDGLLDNVRVYGNTTTSAGVLTQTDMVSAKNLDDAPPPEANFTYSPSAGWAGATGFSFTDTSSGPPTGWQWDVDGDNTTDHTSKNVTGHTYAVPGGGSATYTVRLTASNANGSDSEVKSGIITVHGRPAADFSHADGNDGTYGLSEPIYFTNLSGEPGRSSLGGYGYEWDFDYDGVTFKTGSTAENPAHAYASAAAHKVALRVTNGAGSDLFTRILNVVPEPAALSLLALGAVAAVLRRRR